MSDKACWCQFCVALYKCETHPHRASHTAQECRLSRSRRAFEQDVAARDKRGHQQLAFAFATDYIVAD